MGWTKRTTITKGKGWQIIDTDKGYLDLLAEIDKVKDTTYLTVGVHAKAKPYPNGTSVAKVAATQEFGSSDGRIPQRSFIGSTFDMFHELWLKENAMIIDDFLAGIRSLKAGLKRLGTKQVAAVKETITTLSSPANAPATIRRKGYDDPLMHTKRLRNSINYEYHEEG